MEAEDMELSGYNRYEIGAASGGGCVYARNGTGTATYEFTGPTHDYTMEVAYIDMSDGSATYRLLVDGALVDTWVADDVNSGKDFRVRSYARSIPKGAEIMIETDPDGSDYGPVDYINICSDDFLTWQEHFSLPQNTQTDNGPTSWTPSVDTVGPNGFVGVKRGRLAFTQVRGDWVSEKIDISECSSVSVRLEVASSKGNMESGAGADQDYIRVYGQLDGGAWQAILQRSGNISPKIIKEIDNISASSVRLAIRAQVTRPDERYVVDDIEVVANGLKEEETVYSVVSWKDYGVQL
jgi:hypothetical protein